MKRMSTWDRSFMDAYTPLLFSFTHHVIFLIKMKKDVCACMQIRCEQ